MTSVLPFSIPVSVYEGAGGPVVAQAPYVTSLSTNSLAGAVAAVLTTAFGSDSAGLYLLFNNRWNFVVPYTALNNFIISGGQISVYAGLLSPVTPTAGATVYRNGVQSSATTLTTDPVVWATVLVSPASGYVLPAASASVLGGVKQGSGVTIAGDGTISVTSAGTVTSVAMTIPSILTVTGTPITGAGTLALGLATQAPAIVFAGPLSGANAVPTFRALATTDIPALPYAPTASPTFTGTVGAVAITATGLVTAAGVTLSAATNLTMGTGIAALATASSVTVPTVAGTADSTTKAASTAFVQAVVTANKAVAATASVLGLVLEAADVAATANTNGVAAGAAVVDVTATPTQATINANFTYLANQINAILTSLKAAGHMV